MNKNICLFATVASALFLSSCSKLKLTEDNFKVTPTPLEYVAGEVPATISIKMPAKTMKKKATVECIPVLKWNGGTATGQSFTVQGEKVQANNQTISYKRGGNASMSFSVPFQEGMESSDLYMKFNAKKGSKKVNIPDVKIGYGTLSTAALITECAKSANFSVAPDQFQRVIAQKQEAAVKFLIGQANLRGSELNSQNIRDFIATLRNIKNDQQSLVLNNVEIAAYASPDGAYSVNERLADRRGQVSQEYVKKQLSNNKLTTNIDTRYTAEDWEGFQQLVQQSNLQDKEIILSVLSMYSDPEEREREIRNISVVYKDLAEAVLPELRRARMIINYDVIGRSDDEIISQFSADPTLLSSEEMIYAANRLAETKEKKETILKQMTKQYANDYRAYNNLAVLAMQQGDNDAAQEWLQKALSVSGNNAPEASINQGLIALQQGLFKDAEMYIGKGATAASYDDALGNLYIAQGKYAEAANKFTNSTASNSAILANILANNYAEAQRMAEGIKTPDATTAYLQAILAARMGSKTDVKEYLELAKQLNSKYAQRAATDLEFKNVK